MLKAQEAEPTILEVLLRLGVSHTNELEQQEALGYLRSWLQNHPRYGKLVPQDGSAEGLGHEEVRHYGEAQGSQLECRVGLTNSRSFLTGSGLRRTSSTSKARVV